MDGLFSGRHVTWTWSRMAFIYVQSFCCNLCNSCFPTQNFNVPWGQVRHQGYRAQDLIKWEKSSSATIWYIWKCRCKKCFKGIVVPPTETVSTIWKSRCKKWHLVDNMICFWGLLMPWWSEVLSFMKIGIRFYFTHIIKNGYTCHLARYSHF